MWTSQPSGSRWQIAAGLSDIDAMDGRGECSDYRNRKDSCEDRQSHMRTPSVAPVEIVVHGQHPLEHESTQPLGTGSSAAPVVFRPVPSPSRAAKAAEFSRKHIPAATASHNMLAPAPSRSNHRMDSPHRHRARRSRTRRSCGSGDGGRRDGGSLQARLQYSGPPFAVDNSSDYAWVITMQPTSADEHQRPDDVGGDPADMAFPKSDDRLIRQLRDLADLR